jgi:hypothetical protein
MGSIFRQSIQVPAKNSIKIKSFCPGASPRDGVSVATGAGGAIVEGTIGGEVLSAGPQENAREESTKATKKSLKNILISIYSPYFTKIERVPENRDAGPSGPASLFSGLF